MNQTFKLVLAGQALIETPVAITTDAASRLATEIGAAHMAATNFEGTLDAPHAWPLKAKTLHVATPDAMASLRKLGFSALALANNHAFDLGPPALAATRLQAQTCGFATAGSGEDIVAAGAPALASAGGMRVALLAFDLGPQLDIVYAGEHKPGINPLRMRNALVLPAGDAARLAAIAKACGYEERMKRRVQVGYSDAPPGDSLDFFGVTVETGSAIAERRYPDPHDLARALACISSARAVADLVLVSAHHHHWDANWAAAPPWLAKLGAALIQAGADAVFFHGSPVLQGMSFHGGRPIFHGLGNFIFHTARAARYDNARIDAWRSVVARCEFGMDRTLRSVHIRPIRVGLPLSKSAGAEIPPAPELLHNEEAEEVIDSFLARSMLDGAIIERDQGACMIRPAASAKI